MALAAVDLLRGAGFKAEHLDLGPADLAERRFALITTVPSSPSTSSLSSSSSVPSRAKARVRSPA
jgi:hypothetical protein